MSSAAIQGNPDQIAGKLISLIPALESVGATYYQQEALLALNAVLPAMFDQRLPITTQSVATLLSNPRQLLDLSNALPESAVKMNLSDYLKRFTLERGVVDSKHMQNVLGGLTARLAMAS